MATLSNCYLAALPSHIRWLPCPAAVGPDYTDLPAVVAVWSQEMQQHFLLVGGARQDTQTRQVQRLASDLPPLHHPGTITDLQVAAVQQDLVVATASSNGSVNVLLLRLPPSPGASLEDLQLVRYADNDGDGSDGDADMASQQQQQQNNSGSSPGQGLIELPDLHEAAVASVDINTPRQSLLSVAGDGSICVVPLDALDRAGGDESTFKSRSAWGGFCQGRWVDSSTFATAGQLGGLQLWDVRAGPCPVAASQPGWGTTGCGQLDRQQGAARQLLCLDVHPSRPNLAASGASGGSVALWDLRLAAAPLSLTGGSSSSGAPAGDVWEVRFDPCDAAPSSGGAAALPPLLYCTSDGGLCRATAAAADAGRHGSSGGGQALTVEVLAAVECSVNSFDVEPSVGSDILAVTDFERMLLLHRPDCAA